MDRVLGLRPEGHRSPAGDLSPHTLDLLMAHGFTYDLLSMGHDYLPYRPQKGDHTPLLEPAVLGEPVDLIELPVAWSLDDFPAFDSPPPPAAAPARLAGAGELDGGLRLDRKPAADHLHLPPLRLRTRPPDAGDGTPDRLESRRPSSCWRTGRQTTTWMRHDHRHDPDTRLGRDHLHRSLSATSSPKDRMIMCPLNPAPKANKTSRSHSPEESEIWRWNA